MGSADNCAPIAIFAYDRPEHFRATLHSLERCPEWQQSRVIVYSDGPRTHSDVAAVAEVRALARSLDHADVELIERESNLGLAKSIIRGVSEVCERFGRVVVVEDDLLVSAGFLGYLNRALDTYAERHDVYQISAHMYDVPEFSDRDSSLLLPITTTWGWATWQRAWQNFRADSRGWDRLKLDSAYRKRFNLGNHYDYYTMLRRQMSGRRDSWGIRWYWTVFAADGLICFPPRSLVQNAGMDGSGTHGRGTLRRFGGMSLKGAPLKIDIPKDASRCSDAELSAIKRAIWTQNGGWLGWAMDQTKAMGARLQAALASDDI